MLTKVYSATVVGIGAEIVEVEVDILPGLPVVIVVGLPDVAVKEARERVRSALKHSSSVFPLSRVAINLAPADVPKIGTQFDLPIAVSILINSGQLAWRGDKTLFLGELALDGGVRPVTGVLPIVLFAKDKGFDTIIVPQENAQEAALVSGVKIIPIASLSQIVSHLQGVAIIPPQPNLDIASLAEHHEAGVDLKDVRGQEQAKRALEIAASGGHNLLMSGPPGSGKTMLARVFATILPRLSAEEILEVTKVHSVAGTLSGKGPLALTRPFRAPHHTASAVSLVGGGSVPRPGEISLAHRGVLFLDEFPEFGTAVLESLRQPLEDGVITVSRAAGSVTFPARFTLIAAQNPCPCGYYNDPVKACVCAPGQVLRYAKKISGPLLDRIDLHVEVPRVTYDKISQDGDAESSEKVRERVERARDRQRQRFTSANIPLQANAEMGVREVRRFCVLDAVGQELLRTALNSLHLSARSYYRVLKVARTIADLAAADQITVGHLAEALQYRPKEE